MELFTGKNERMICMIFGENETFYEYMTRIAKEHNWASSIGHLILYKWLDYDYSAEDANVLIFTTYKGYRICRSRIDFENVLGNDCISLRINGHIREFIPVKEIEFIGYESIVDNRHNIYPTKFPEGVNFDDIWSPGCPDWC